MLEKLQLMSQKTLKNTRENFLKRHGNTLKPIVEVEMTRTEYQATIISRKTLIRNKDIK